MKFLQQALLVLRCAMLLARIVAKHRGEARCKDNPIFPKDDGEQEHEIQRNASNSFRHLGVRVSRAYRRVIL